MVDIREKAKKLFGTEESCREIPGAFSCAFVRIGKLPLFSEIRELYKAVAPRDSMEITFSDKFSSVTLKSTEDSEAYRDFVAGVSEGDLTRVSIEIRKNAENSVVSVYCLEKLLDFLTEEADTFTQLRRWNDVIRKTGGSTAFEIFDRNAEFCSGAFIFTNNAVGFDPETDVRKERTRLANEACTFMERRTIRLLPGDFDVKSLPPKTGTWIFEGLAKSMRRLDTVMALIYLGASSRIEDETVTVKENEVEKKTVIFDIVRGGGELHIPLDDITENENLTKLVGWVLSEQNASERAEIARNTVSLMCTDEKKLLEAKPGVLGAVRSSYRLYQKKNVDKYVEVKKKLNDSILEAAKKIEELIGALVDGLKTNFIAVITVLTTQVLGGHIDLDKLFKGNFVDVKFTAVVYIYCIASFIYLLTTGVYVIAKWDFYRRYFNDIKENFSKILDSEELDAEWGEAKKIRRSATIRLIIYGLILAALWGFLIWAVWHLGSRL